MHKNNSEVVLHVKNQGPSSRNQSPSLEPLPIYAANKPFPKIEDSMLKTIDQRSSGLPKVNHGHRYKR